MKKFLWSVIVACAISSNAHGWTFNPPHPDLPDNWPPYGQNTDALGPDATRESRQRRKLAIRIFGNPHYPREFCHVDLLATPEKPNPAYRAKNLGMHCLFRGRWFLFPW